MQISAPKASHSRRMRKNEKETGMRMMKFRRGKSIEKNRGHFFTYTHTEYMKSHRVKIIEIKNLPS